MCISQTCSQSPVRQYLKDEVDPVLGTIKLEGFPIKLEPIVCKPILSHVRSHSHDTSKRPSASEIHVSQGQCQTPVSANVSESAVVPSMPETAASETHA